MAAFLLLLYVNQGRSLVGPILSEMIGIVEFAGYSERMNHQLESQDTLPRKSWRSGLVSQKGDFTTCFESIGYVIRWEAYFSANPPEKVGGHPPRLSMLGETIDNSQMFSPVNNLSNSQLEDHSGFYPEKSRRAGDLSENLYGFSWFQDTVARHDDS